MKKCIIQIILHLIVISALKAQSVRGTIKDEEGAKGGATVELHRAKDSSVIKLTLSKLDGTYIFTDIKEDRYFISISHIGYYVFQSPQFAVEGGDPVSIDARLQPVSSEMQAIEVKSQKPLIEVSGNKIILNIEGNANSIGSDMLDLLRKAPGIVVSRDCNINLNGKNGIAIYIDDKRVDLNMQQLASYLSSIPSSQVQTIEIISNPSASFDAEGNAGIINVRLKKDRSLGTNGTFDAGLNIGTYAKVNSGFSINYRNKKLNIFGNYSYNHSINATNNVSERTVADTFFHQTGLLKQGSDIHNIRAGFDYSLSKKHMFGIMVRSNFSDLDWNNNSQTMISNISTLKENRILKTNNTRDQGKTYAFFNANYNYSNAGNLVMLNLDHNIYYSSNRQYLPNNYYDTTGTNLLYSTAYRIIAPVHIHINSAKVDWVRNFKTSKLETGFKTSFVHSLDDFDQYIPGSGQENLSDHNYFNYYENINAAYLNYSKVSKHMTVEGGLRAELTSLHGLSTSWNYMDSKSKDSAFKRQYLNIFPAFSLNYVLGKNFSAGINYNLRIDRPAYQNLNPFEFKLDEYNLQRGNINLRPQYTQALSANLAYKNKLKLIMTYSRIKDMYILLSDTTNGSKSVLIYENLNRVHTSSFNLSYPWQYRFLSVFASLLGTYTRFREEFGAGRVIDQQVKALNANLQASGKISKTFSFDLTTYYNSSDLYEGSFVTRPVWTLDAGFSQVLAKGSLILKEAVTDIFHTLHYRDESNFAGQRTIIYTHFESRLFKIGLSWRFGNNQVRSAREHASSSDEENKRVN